MKKEKEHAIEFAKYVVNDHLFNFHLLVNEDFLDLWYKCFLNKQEFEKNEGKT